MARARKSSATPVVTEKILILILAGNEEKKVTVPSDSKITFGPAIPGGKGPGWVDSGGRLMEYAVRIYDGPTEKAGLLAVFTGVREFRIETVKVSKLVIRESGKSLWKSDEDGFETTTSVKKERTMLPEGF